MEPLSPHSELERLKAELEETKRLLRELEEEQRVRNSEQERFAYVVSHDLKSPLASIVLTGEMLRENLGDAIDEGNEQLLGVLNRASMKIKNLADGILAYYRGERAMNDEPETFALGPFMLTIVDMLKAGPDAEIHYPTAGVSVYANKSALEQILINLLQNALRHNDKGKAIVQIHFRETAAFYFFEVEDNGPGIAGQDQQRIFELFTSLRNDRSGIPFPGIGLSTVKKLVEKEGGEIHVRSVLQQGSVFVFSIRKKKEAISGDG